MNDAEEAEIEDEEPYGTVETLDILPTTEEQIEAFLERFRVVSREAQALGFTALFALCVSDPISREDHYNYGVFGNSFAARGLFDIVSKRVFD